MIQSCLQEGTIKGRGEEKALITIEVSQWNQKLVS